MANKIYSGATGTWEDADFTPAGKPIDADLLVFPATVTTNVAGSDQSLIDLGHLETAAGFVGNIGTDGDPLRIDAVKVIHKGSGTFRLKCDIASDPTEWIIIDSDNTAGLAMHIDGGTVNRISVKKGTVVGAATLGAGGVLLAKLEVAYRNNPASDAIVTLNEGMLASTGLINMTGGRVNLNGTVTNKAFPLIHISGGLVTFETTNSPTTDELHIMGGQCDYKSEGTLTYARVAYGGTLNLAANELYKTVTNLDLEPGGVLIYNPDTTTFTNTIKNWGGTIYLGEGGVPI
jgi:hypothetical protein